MENHPQQKLGLSVPGISATSINPDGTKEEVTYEGLVAYYKEQQEKGKRRKNEA